MRKRETLGEHVLAAFEATDDALNGLLAQLDPQDWEKPCYQIIGQIPVRCFIDLRLQELVIHGWDIRSRFGPEAPLSPESLPSLMDMLALLTPRWAFWPGEKLASPLRYHFDVTGAVPTTIDLIVEGDTAHVAERSDRQPDVTVRCDTETYVLMRYGRISLAAALATGRAAVAGDQAAAIAFGRWFKGI
jgi:hypothetical protein